MEERHWFFSLFFSLFSPHPDPASRIFMAQKAGSLSVIHSVFIDFKAKALFEVPAHVPVGY